MNGTLPRRVTLAPLKAREYTHFDHPLSAAALEKFSVSDEEVASHSFYPLLGYRKKERRLEFDENDHLTIKVKPRDIRYASHRDAAIFSLYSQEISTKFEGFLNEFGLEGSVLAYRSGIGSNIDFAADFFGEIRKRGKCYVVCLDITKFFDNLDHAILKTRLCGMLGADRLSPAWFKIYERLTRYDYVMGEDLEPVIGKIRPPRICDAKTFRSKVRPLVRRHDKPYGIPQGTPLSGLLANVYMSQFDLAAHKVLQDVGGSYRRYSDDIALVFPDSSCSELALENITNLLGAHGLSANDKKTCRSAFSVAAGEQVSSLDECQYLGFTFDGRRILIRSASLRRFYSRMKRSLNRYIKAAARSGIPPNELRRRLLVGKFTHWGDGRNFVQYSYRAARKMNSPDIKRQLRRHVLIFDEHWERLVEKWYRSPPV